MNVLILRNDFTFGVAQPNLGQIWQAIGGNFISKWNKINFIITESKESQFIAQDCIAMNTQADGCLLSKRATEILSPLLAESAQLLPVDVMGQPYWWLNCISVVDGIAQERVDVDWSVVSGKWGSFKWISGTRRLEFRDDQLRKAPILFRVPEYPQGMLFAKDEFCSVVMEYGLTGFVFDPVWSSITGGIFYPWKIETSRMFDVPAKATIDHRRKPI